MRDEGRTRLGGRSRDEVESERESGRGGVGDVRELAGEGGRAGRPGAGFEALPGEPGRMGIGRICVMKSEVSEIRQNKATGATHYGRVWASNGQRAAAFHACASKREPERSRATQQGQER